MLRAIGALLIAVVLLSAPAYAQKRIALVIGNQGYDASVGPLKNPHNDIAVVGEALGEVGFKMLTPRKDATRDEMLFAVHELATQLRAAGNQAVGFLYYAGHGVSVGMDNVLIPTNVENTTDAMLAVRGVRLAEILDILKREAPDAVNFVVLDACRNIRGRRGNDRGWLPMPDRRTGVVIAFSTGPGETATDEGAKSAPYAAALADEIVKPGRNDLVVFHEVRTRVVRETSGQTPWTHDGLVGERVVFKPARPVPPPGPPISVNPSEAAEAWAATKDTQSTVMLEIFIRRFGDTYFGELAKMRLAELNEAAKQRLKAESDARAELENRPPVQQSDRVQWPVDDAAVARTVQEELKRVGCYQGATDGKWGLKSREALVAFHRDAQAGSSDGNIGSDTLELIRRQTKRVCSEVSPRPSPLEKSQPPRRNPKTAPSTSECEYPTVKGRGGRCVTMIPPR